MFILKQGFLIPEDTGNSLPLSLFGLLPRRVFPIHGFLQKHTITNLLILAEPALLIYMVLLSINMGILSIRMLRDMWSFGLAPIWVRLVQTKSVWYPTITTKQGYLE